jgi:hypothetical protein
VGRATKAAPLLAALALVAAGCGSSTILSPKHAPPHIAFPGLGGDTVPAPGPTGAPANGAAVKVIEAWSTDLRRGDIRAAARYFQLPSELVNGVGPGGTLALIRIQTLAQAVAANETLPCGAQFVSADERGLYVNALFRLTGRAGPGGSSCGSGTEGTARTNFLIRDGRIVEWIRAPDDPGDNGSGGGGPVV